MSRTIDERIVSMQFDNKQFESNVQTSLGTLEKLKRSLNFNGAAKGFENIESAVKKVDVSSLGNAAHTVGLRFSALYTVADQVLRNITNRVQQTADHMVRTFTTDPIKTGFKEYETQINAVQTILANTQSKGTTLDDVNQALDTLNTYADKTIYNFTEMTRNIGTFTAAGTDLETSVNAIQGIANLAAISGSTSQQASTAMYQLSQALASGTVKLMDWNSVVNAGMGGQVFQDALKETARVHGVAIDQMIKENGSFRETLQEGWLTADILTETLQKFTLTTEGLTDAEIELNRQMLKGKGYSDEQIEGIFKLGETATNAATKVKTATQLFDTLKEAAQSGWTQTWELIVGDFEESKELWTNISDEIGTVINNISEARNTLLKDALTSNWDKLIEKVNEAGIETSVFEDKVKEAMETAGYDVDKLIGHYGSLEKVFKSGAVTSNILKKAINGIGDSIATVDLSTIVKNLKRGIKGEDVSKIQQVLSDLGYDLSKFGVDGIFGPETEAAVKAFQEFAGLEITGIVDDATLEALTKATEKTIELDESIGDLINGVSELGGRELLIKSFANVWNALKKPLVAVKKAWSEVFDAMKPEELYAMIEGFESFTSKLIMNDESADKVRRTFKGLFSALEVVTTIIGGGVKVAFKVLSKILEHFDLNLLDVAASVGDAMVKFRDWMFENNMLAGVLDKTVEYAVKAGVAIKNWVKTFVELPAVQKSIKQFQTAFAKAFAKIKTIFSDVGGIFKDFFKNLFSTDSFSMDNVKMAFLTLYETLRSYFSSLSVTDIFSGIGDAFKKFKDAAKKYLEGAGIKIDEIRDKIVSFANIVKEKIGDNMGSILAVGILLTFLLLVKKIKDAVELIANPLDSIGDFLGTLGGTLKSFSKAAKAVALKNIAVSIAILAGSVAVLAMLDQKKVWSSVGAILALSTILVGISLLLGKFKPGDFGKLSASILGLAGAVLLMGIAAKTVSGVSGEGLLKTAFVMATFLGIVALMAKATKGTSMWVAEFGKMMIKLSIALLILATITKIFGNMDTGTLIQGGIAVAAFLGMMIAVMRLSGTGNKYTAKFGSMMLGISAGLILMSSAIKILGRMDTGEIVRGGLVIAAFLGVTVLMAKVTKNLGKHSAQFGKMMFGLGASLLLMAMAIKILGSMDKKTVSQGAGAVAALLGVMALMMGATKLLGKNAGSAAKVGVMMLAFSGALLILTASIGILGMMDASNIDKAIGAITKVGILFAAMVALSRFAGEAATCKGTIMTMAIAVGILAVSIAALSFVDSSKLTGATIALSVVMGMFALLVGMTGLIKKSAGTLIIMTGAIAILGGILYLLAGLPVESTLGAATSLAILILSLSATCLLLSLVPVTGALTGIASLAILIAGVGLLMAAIAGLNRLFPDMESFLNESLPIIETIGQAIGSFVGSIIGGFMGGASSGFGEIGTNLSTFMTNLGPFIEGAKGLDETAMTGVKNLAETIMLLTGASLLESIASWATGESSLTSFAEELVPFGEAMATFSSKVSGNIDEGAVTAAANAGKIMASMASEIPNSGGVLGFIMGENSMATFAAELVSFGTAIASFSSTVSGKVDESAVTAAANAGKIMANMASEIPNSGGILSWIMGDNDIDDFGTKLVSFGACLATFSSSVSGIDEAAITSAASAGTLLANFNSAIPTTGGLWSLMGGDKNLGDFGTQLSLFGYALKNFSTTVTGIDETAMTTAASAGAKLAELNNAIPTTGGIWGLVAGDKNLGDFGIQLCLFGAAMKDFSATVTGIDETAITAAASAGTQLATLANNLPESGGLWSVFSADNDMSTFASEIKKFGSGIKDFSDSVAGMDTSGVWNAISVANSLSRLAKSMSTAGEEGDLSEIGTGAKDFGKNLKSFYTQVSEIDTKQISSVITEFTNLAAIDFSGLSTLDTTLSTLGKTGVSNFVKAFTDASSTIKTTGSGMVTNLISGVTSKSSSFSNVFKALSVIGVVGAKSKYADFYIAGKYLVDGFAAGISANSYKAAAKARAMANAAARAAEEALDEHSPSKVFYGIGDFAGQGFVNALVDYEDKSYAAGGNMAESARSGLARAIGNIRDIIENGIDAQPTIRPVLDLSDVESGAGAISGMFNSRPSITAMGHVGAISSMMAKGQNGTNGDVISAINDLGKKLGNVSGNTTYQVNGVTYDDGSNVASAVNALIRAARVERRV